MTPGIEIGAGQIDKVRIWRIITISDKPLACDASPRPKGRKEASNMKKIVKVVHVRVDLARLSLPGWGA